MVIRVEIKNGEDVLFIAEDAVAQAKVIDVGKEYSSISVVNFGGESLYLSANEDWDKFMELVKKVDKFIKENN